MDWGRPENMIWFLIVPVFIGLSFYVISWRNRSKRKFADPELIQRLFPSKSNSFYWLSLVLLVFGLIFSILALMDPLYGEEQVQSKREGTDIIYALDLSNSMYAEDVAPSRLEKAKKIIFESVQRLGGDRVGLIVFAEDAYAITPLTTDYNAILSYVESASPDLITNQGTNFSAVAQTAVDMFSGTGTASKILVLISDGEDNQKSLTKAEKLLKKNNIHAVSLGIGTLAGAPIPMQYDNFEEYKMDRYGETVISKLNENSLRSLAESSSGIYIPVSHTDASLSQLHAFINKQQKEKKDITYKLDKKHAFQWFLAFAFAFIFIDTLTSEYRLFNNKNR